MAAGGSPAPRPPSYSNSMCTWDAWLPPAPNTPAHTPAPPSPSQLPHPPTLCSQATIKAVPSRRFRREGGAADLSCVMRLPVWHNAWKREVRVRTICGQRPVVVPAAEAVGRGGMTVRLPGLGMPVRGTGSRPAECERGDLRVEIRLRTAREELRYVGQLVGVAGAGGAVFWAAYVAAGGLGGMARVAARGLARTARLWLRLSLGLLSVMVDPRGMV